MLQPFYSPRVILVILIQLPISAIFIYFTFIILQRRRDRVSYSHGTFYMLNSLAFILDAISIMISMISIIYLLQVTRIFFTLLSLVFLVLFNLNILRSESEFNLRTQILIILLFSVGIYFIFCIPGGITINEQTNCRPKCSVAFTITAMLYITCLALIPMVIQSIRIYQQFKVKQLKERWRLYCIGLSGVVFVIIGGLFYTILSNLIYEQVWLFLSLIIIPSVALIYLGIGKHLKIQQ